MSETIERPRRFHFHWLFPALFRPGATFKQIIEYPYNSWLTPLLVLSLTAVALVVATGPLRQAAVQSGATMPPDFFYYTPEQQAQFMRAQEGLASPVFIYVFPGVLAVVGVWLGWVLVGNILHLLLTTFGSHGSTRTALHLLAWASLPFAVRDLVRAAFTLATQQLIQSAGLAGFAPPGTDFGSAFLGAFLALIDLYVFWQLFLLVSGVRATSGLSLGKSLTAVGLTLLLVLALQALPPAILAQFSALGMIQPFF